MRSQGHLTFRPMNIEAFILIGGRSSRLGTDKAFVEIGGQTIASHAAEIAMTALKPTRITFVSGDERQFNAQKLSSLGHRVISDLRPGFGAWSAIETALAAAGSEWIFILACDLPFVSIEALRLLESFTRGDNDAVVPRQPDGKLQPLCAFYRVKTVHAAVKKVFIGHRSLPPLSAICDDLKTCIVSREEFGGLANAERFFLNINTAADLQAATEYRNSILSA